MTRRRPATATPARKAGAGSTGQSSGNLSAWGVANSSKDSAVERAVRSSVHRAGYRFRKHVELRLATRRIRVDLLFRSARVAVFVDGCFWHSCPDHGGRPRSDERYWPQKLRRNVERDRAVDAALQAAGWRVVRLWEHLGPAPSARIIGAVVREGSRPKR